jgi:hypothetical protein
MTRLLSLTLAALVTAAVVAPAFAGDPPKPAMRPLVFQKQRISDETYESADVIDVNKDGKPDVVCGAWWYPGPKFDARHPVAKLEPAGDYYNDFSTIPMDANGDGFTDFVTCGWFDKRLQWRENPQGDPAKEWPAHVIAEPGNVETAMAADIDGDGRPEIIPNTPGGPQRIYRLAVDGAGKPTGKFTEHVVSDGGSGHGLGVGDVNGDSRPDIILAKGWLEAPENPLGGAKWTWHAEFDLGSAGVPTLVADVNRDGRADIIVGQGHGYGLDWWEQRIDGDKRTWVRHAIDPGNSQYHCLMWTDIDGDGVAELVTGKRRHAHRGGDPGDADPAGLYYFAWTGEAFTKQVIDYGVGPAGKGLGIYFAVADLDGDGRPDVVAPGKDGLNVYFNRGFAEAGKR